MDAASCVSLGSVSYFAGTLQRSAPSGLTSYVNTMRDELKRRGVRVRVMAGTADPDDADAVCLPPMRVTWRVAHTLTRTWPSRFARLGERIAIARATAGLACRERISLFEFEENAGLCGLALRLPLRCPVVVRLHGPHFSTGIDLQDPVCDAMELDAVLRASAVSSPSKDVLARARAHWRIPLANAVVIPNPTPRIDSSDCWAGDSQGPILFVGRFDYLKGVDLIVRAFREIAPRYPGRELWIAGPEGHLSEGGRTFRTIAEFLDHEMPDLALRARIKYLGSRTANELLADRRGCSCVVVASRAETFCLAASEAMMAGCPLISSDATALPELVEHERTGLLFRSGDASSLAHALVLLLENPPFARRLGGEAREAALARFSPQIVADQTIEFYQQLIRGSERRRVPTREQAWS